MFFVCIYRDNDMDVLLYPMNTWIIIIDLQM